MRGRRVDSLLTINKTGMPEAPNLIQLLDKDVKLLYLRDKSKNKEMYIKEVGVIYYLGDPKGPCLSAGLSRNEALQKARENFDLPTTYTPDLLVEKLIKRYHDNQTGIAGQAVEALQKAIHNITISTNIINEQLNDKLQSGLSAEDAGVFIDYMDKINKRITDLPNLIASLKKAEEEAAYEEETRTARGGMKVTSSMIEEDF
jgi:hypothetical protein